MCDYLEKKGVCSLMYQGLYGLMERKEELEPIVSSQKAELDKIKEKLNLFPRDWNLRNEYNHHSSYFRQAQREYNYLLKGGGRYKHLNGWPKKKRGKRRLITWSWKDKEIKGVVS